MNDSNCPYCSSKVVDKDVTSHNYAQCTKCGIPHHFQCYCENNSHCGIYGCDGKTISTVPRDISDLVVQPHKELQTKTLTGKTTLDNLFEKYTELTNDCNLDRKLLKEHAINETYGKNTSALQKAYIDDYFSKRFYLDDDYTTGCGIGGIVVGGIIGGVIVHYLWGSPGSPVGLFGFMIGLFPGFAAGFSLGSWISSFNREERTKQLTEKYTKLIESAKEK